MYVKKVRPRAKRLEYAVRHAGQSDATRVRPLKFELVGIKDRHPWRAAKQTPTRRLHRPTGLSSFLVYPPHQRYQYRTYICNRRRFLSQSPMFPNSHPLLFSSSHPSSSFQETEVSQAGGYPERLPGNAGLLYVYIQCHESNGYPEELKGLRRQGNELGRLPTIHYL